jgi:hypothetical protein
MAALVTDVGEQQIAQRINGAGIKPTYVDSGTGTSGPSETDTTLQSPCGEARDNGTPSVVGDTYTVVATHTYAGSFTISEAGLFDAASGGNMYVRGVWIGGIAVSPGDKIQFTINIQIT